MNQKLKAISSRMAAILALAFGQKVRRADHAKLIRHIVALNQKNSSVDIINGVADALKEILDYRLFAFAVQKGKGVDVWLDPRMYKQSMEEIILQDFNIEEPSRLVYINQRFEPNEHQKIFSLKDLIFYELREEKCYARLYILPQKKSYPFNDEVISLILQGCTAALSKQLKIENLKNAAILDPLTGCYNRREFENQMNRHMANARRHNSRLSLFMFDLDHFKQINDTHGHLGGDLILKAVSDLVRTSIRKGDILARYGGEEFIAILPETDKIRAMELADRIRKKIADICLPHNHDLIRVTASFGVAELTGEKKMTQLIEAADTMLYKAKLNGRNTVMPGLIKMICPPPQKEKVRKQ